MGGLGRRSQWERGSPPPPRRTSHAAATTVTVFPVPGGPNTRWGGRRGVSPPPAGACARTAAAAPCCSGFGLGSSSGHTTWGASAAPRHVGPLSCGAGASTSRAIAAAVCLARLHAPVFARRLGSPGLASTADPASMVPASARCGMASGMLVGSHGTTSRTAAAARCGPNERRSAACSGAHALDRPSCAPGRRGHASRPRRAARRGPAAKACTAAARSWKGSGS